MMFCCFDIVLGVLVFFEFCWCSLLFVFRWKIFFLLVYCMFYVWVLLVVLVVISWCVDCLT